jgi:hypothetical protein
MVGVKARKRRMARANGYGTPTRTTSCSLLCNLRSFRSALLPSANGSASYQPAGTAPGWWTEPVDDVVISGRAEEDFARIYAWLAKQRYFLLENS